MLIAMMKAKRTRLIIRTLIRADPFFDLIDFSLEVSRKTFHAPTLNCL